MYKKPCLDSSVFLGGINNEIRNFIKRGPVYRFLLEEARQKKTRLHIATAAIAEVYKAKASGASTSEFLDEFMSLLDEDLLIPIELDRSTAIEAHKLCRLYPRLRPFDSIHLACALSGGCDYLLTWDSGLKGVAHNDISIDHPQIYSTNLFSESPIASPDEQQAWNLAHLRLVRECDKLYSGGEGI